MKIHNFLRIALCFTWSILVIFAIFTIFEPQWLKNISHPGRIVEAAEHKQKGDELLRQRDFAKALNAYQEAVNIYPQLQSAHIGKAIALSGLNRHNQAKAVYENLLAAEPEKAWEIYENLARVYEALRDKENTIFSLQKTIELSPDPFMACLSMARLYFTSGDWENALQYYQMAFDNLPDMKYELLSTLKKERDIYAQKQDLQNIIDTCISEIDQIARKYYQQPYEQKLASDPVIARLHNDTGFCYAMLDDIPKALPYFEQAVKIQPSSQEFKQNLAKARHELGMTQ